MDPADPADPVDLGDLGDPGDDIIYLMVADAHPDEEHQISRSSKCRHFDENLYFDQNFVKFDADYPIRCGMT